MSVSVLACHDGKEQRTERWLNQSILQADSGNHVGALVSSLRALEIAENHFDVPMLAKVNRHIANIYSMSYNSAEELRYLCIAERYYEIQNDRREQLMTKIDEARALWNLEVYDRGLALLDSIRPMIDPKDDSLYNYFQESRLVTLHAMGRKDEFKNQLENYLENNQDHRSISNDMKFEYLLITNCFDKAKICLDSLRQSLGENNHSVLYAHYKYYRAVGAFDTAIVYYEKLMNEQNRRVRETLNVNVTTAHNQYLLSQNVFERRRSSTLKILAWSLCSLAIIIIIVIIIMSRYKLQKKDEEIDSRMAEIKSLAEEIGSRDNALLSLNAQIERNSLELMSLYKSQFATINELCTDYFASLNGHEKLKMVLYNKVEEEILALREAKNLSKLSDALNIYGNNIVNKMKEALPDLKPIDETFLVLTFAGLSTKAISIICNITLGNCYNKRQRLRDKIDNTNSPYKAQLIKGIGF